MFFHVAGVVIMRQGTDKLLTSVKKYSIFPEMRNSDQDFFLKSAKII